MADESNNTTITEEDIKESDAANRLYEAAVAEGGEVEIKGETFDS